MLCAPSQADLMGLFSILSCNLKHIRILHDPLIVSAEGGIGCDDNPVFLADTDGFLSMYMGLISIWLMVGTIAWSRNSLMWLDVKLETPIVFTRPSD